MGRVVDYLDRDLPNLLELLRGTDIRELELHEGSMRVRLTRVPSRRQDETPSPGIEPLTFAPLEPSVAEIASPLVGTFYRAGQPGIPPLVSEGARVTPETIVGFIDVLGEPTEVESGYAGVITFAHATDGQTVEYGQTLFEVQLGD